MRRILQYWDVLGTTILATAISYITVGYSVWTGDQFITIPQIYHAANPLYLSRDFVVSFSQSQFSVFGASIEALMHVTGMPFETIALPLEILTRLLFFFGVYLMARYLAGDRLRAALVALCLVASSGVELPLIDAYLYPRNITLGLVLISLVLFMRGRSLLPALLSALAVIIHPIVAILGLAVQGGLFVYSYATISLKRLMPWFIPFAALGVLYFIGSLQQRESGSPFIIDPVWRSIVVVRNYYVYIYAWPIFDIVVRIGLLAFAAALIVYIKSNSSLRRALSAVVIATIVCTFAVLILGDILNIALIVQIQLMRIYQLLKIFTILCAAVVLLSPEEYMLSAEESLFLFGATIGFVVFEPVALPFVAGFALLQFRRFRPWLPKLLHVNPGVIAMLRRVFAWGAFGFLALFALYVFRNEHDRLFTGLAVATTAVAGMLLRRNHRFTAWCFIIPVLFIVPSFCAGIVNGQALGYLGCFLIRPRPRFFAGV